MWDVEVFPFIFRTKPHIPKSTGWSSYSPMKTMRCNDFISFWSCTLFSDPGWVRGWMIQFWVCFEIVIHPLTNLVPRSSCELGLGWALILQAFASWGGLVSSMQYIEVRQCRSNQRRNESKNESKEWGNNGLSVFFFCIFSGVSEFLDIPVFFFTRIHGRFHPEALQEKYKRQARAQNCWLIWRHLQNFGVTNYD